MSGYIQQESTVSVKSENKKRFRSISHASTSKSMPNACGHYHVRGELSASLLLLRTISLRKNLLKPLFGRFTGELAPLVGADEVAVKDSYAND